MDGASLVGREADLQTASCAPGLDGSTVILAQLSDCRPRAAATTACVEHGTHKAAFAAGGGMMRFEPALVFVAVFRCIS